MENPYAAPSAAQSDGTRGVDDVQLRRANPHPSPADGAFKLAWERVKERPVETILLAVLSTIFGDGRCGGGGGNIPTNFGDTGGYDSGSDVDWGGGGYDDSTYQYITDVDLHAMIDFLPGADLLGLHGMVGQMGGLEIGLILGVLAFAVVVGTVMFVIGVALQAAEDIYWLRILRGQSADLGRSFSVGKYMIPIIVAQILVFLGTMLGLLALIVGAIILAIGWMFVGKVAVDKNLGFVDALKASWRLTDGYKMDLFVMSIIAFFLTMLGVLACCVGMFVAAAVTQGAFAIFYHRIAEPGNSYLQPGEDPGGDGFAMAGYGGGYDQYGGGPMGGGPGGSAGGQGGQGGPGAPGGDDPYGAQW
jgi:hypothetical protein